jgi:hypothetical protein
MLYHKNSWISIIIGIIIIIMSEYKINYKKLSSCIFPVYMERSCNDADFISLLNLIDNNNKIKENGI